MAVGADDVGTSNGSSMARDPGEQRYRQLLEHSPDPLCVHADGRAGLCEPRRRQGNRRAER